MSEPRKPEVYELYETMVDWFDTHRHKGLMEKEYLDLVIKTIPQAGSILDLGCGTGEPIAKFFIENGYRVTGIDASQNMIQLCQKRFPGSRFICADMRTLALRERFDAVIAWDSFFHLVHDDQRRMFEKFESYINPGGVLVFTSGPSHGEVLGEMNGYQVFHASLAVKEYNALLEHHHFVVLCHKTEDPQCGDHTVWVAQAR